MGLFEAAGPVVADAKATVEAPSVPRSLLAVHAVCFVYSLGVVILGALVISSNIFSYLKYYTNLSACLCCLMFGLSLAYDLSSRPVAPLRHRMSSQGPAAVRRLEPFSLDTVIYLLAVCGTLVTVSVFWTMLRNWNPTWSEAPFDFVYNCTAHGGNALFVVLEVVLRRVRTVALGKPAEPRLPRQVLVPILFGLIYLLLVCLPYYLATGIAIYPFLDPQLGAVAVTVSCIAVIFAIVASFFAVPFGVAALVEKRIRRPVPLVSQEQPLYPGQHEV
jgi:hypothetical protein